jgi:hypothetical protein
LAPFKRDPISGSNEAPHERPPVSSSPAVRSSVPAAFDWLERRECPIAGCGHAFEAHEGRCTVDGCLCLLRFVDLEPHRKRRTRTFNLVLSAVELVLSAKARLMRTGIAFDAAALALHGRRRTRTFKLVLSTEEHQMLTGLASDAGTSAASWLRAQIRKGRTK